MWLHQESLVRERQEQLRSEADAWRLYRVAAPARRTPSEILGAVRGAVSSRLGRRTEPIVLDLTVGHDVVPDPADCAGRALVDR
jgi:hypothetical protein